MTRFQLGRRIGLLRRLFSKQDNTGLHSNPEPAEATKDFHCICGAVLEPFVQHGETTHREVNGIITDIHHCKQCDHVQFAPLPSPEWLTDFYKSSEFWDVVGLDPNLYIEQWVTHSPQLKFLDLVQKAAYTLPDDPIRLHDFACGYGGMVKALRDKGMDATGSDLSTSTIEFGQGLGLPLSIGGIPDLLDLEPVDIITAYHAAEHFLDPNAFLSAAEKTLKPGGFLVLAFPNGAYAPARIDCFNRYDWCFFPGHIHYYTPRSIEAALQRHGLELVSLESNSDSETGAQKAWLINTMTEGQADADLDLVALLASMDSNLQSRDLRVVGRKPVGVSSERL